MYFSFRLLRTNASRQWHAMYDSDDLQAPRFIRKSPPTKTEPVIVSGSIQICKHNCGTLTNMKFHLTRYSTAVNRDAARQLYNTPRDNAFYQDILP